MRLWAISILLLAVSACACEREKAGVSSAGRTVETADRSAGQAESDRPSTSSKWQAEGVALEVRYTAYGSFEEATTALPAGSVDAMFLDLTSPVRQEVLVEVSATHEAGKPPPTHFETTLHLRGGGLVRKTWSAAEGNAKGSYKALISAPGILERAETRLAGAEPQAI
ncbi:MAG: hypothetical protein JXR96_15850 [Deltaproteobacteria bacterium]|nr:hypothetical protein [Deltaproteobacteria bacterium]